MFNKWKYGTSRVFFAPDTGADGAGSATVGGEGAEPEPDYKALYEKAKAENAKAQADYANLKKTFDKTASETAELKRAQRAKMSEEEKLAAENAEKEQRYKELQVKVQTMETVNVFAKNGFDEKDYESLSKTIVEVGGERASELTEAVVEFVKKANKSAVSSAQNGALKDGAVTPKTSTAKPEENSIAKQVFEANKPNANSQNIKNLYK